MEFSGNQIKLIILTLIIFSPFLLLSQGALEDYQRADSLKSLVQDKVYHSIEEGDWVGFSHRYWYRMNTKRGKEFVLIDADQYINISDRHPSHFRVLYIGKKAKIWLDHPGQTADLASPELTIYKRPNTMTSLKFKMREPLVTDIANIRINNGCTSSAPNPETGVFSA